MPTIKCKKKLSSNCRDKIRDEVAGWFLQEEPGEGKGDLTSRAIYEVEEYGGLVIELHRPAVLNKGFDFTVQINGMRFQGSKKHKLFPSHDDICTILTGFKKENPKIYNQKIIGILNNFYECNSVDLDSKNSIGHFIDCDNKEQPIEIVLLCIKWLFIEQDITYWNWSGREKLYLMLKTQNLI